MENKQRIQFIVLICIVAAGVGYFYLDNVWQLTKQQNSALRNIDSLKIQINTHSAELRQLNATALTQNSPDEIALEKALLLTVPETPLATCPKSLNTIITRNQAGSARSSLGAMLPFPNTNEMLLENWDVQIAETKSFAAGSVLADIENTFPLAQITQISLSSIPGSSWITATFTVQFLVKP